MVRAETKNTRITGLDTNHCIHFGASNMNSILAYMWTKIQFEKQNSPQSDPILIRQLKKNCSLIIAGICIALNYSGKHKRTMITRGIKLTGEQLAAIELNATRSLF